MTTAAMIQVGPFASPSHGGTRRAENRTTAYRPPQVGTDLSGFGGARDLMEMLGFYSRAPSHFTRQAEPPPTRTLSIGPPLDESPFVSDSLVEGFMIALPETNAPSRIDLDYVQSVVRSYEFLEDDWEEEGSLGPSRDIVEDALVVLQNWPSSTPIPEPELVSDGTVSLEIYDEDGFTLGGVELIGGHRAVYSVNKRAKTLGKGSFDTTSQSQVLSALSNFYSAWEE